MCDTLIAVPPYTTDGSIWFAKNSDREPGEAQLVEHLPQRKYPQPSRLKCTWIEIPQVTQSNEILISRPFWMWGAEIGTNQHGVTIGNEAVFTKLPYAKVGLTGMDLLRLALERTSTAREALDLIVYLIERHGQGGGCGYRNQKFRYHNSFIIADPREAWVLETADKFWVAEKVRGLRTISNVLTIGKEFDLIGAGTYEFARSHGWCSNAGDFDFAHSFGDPGYRKATGGEERRACTLNTLHSYSNGVALREMMTALRDHAGHHPSNGWRMKMPCAHASWMLTRQAGQTTGSMISQLRERNSLHWLTGTSSPCLSVFKPVRLGGELLNAGAAPGAGYDPDSLYWQHEKLHRLVLRNYDKLSRMIERERREIEDEGIRSIANGESNYQSGWDRHLKSILTWSRVVEKEAPAAGSLSLFQRFWGKQSKMEKIMQTR